MVKLYQISNVYLQHSECRQGIAEHQHYTWVAMVVDYLDLAKVVQVTVSAFEDLQVVALNQVIELEVVIVEDWYFG